MQNKIENKIEKFDLIELNKNIDNFPQAKTFGELVVENYDVVINSINNLFEKIDNFPFKTPTTQKEYNDLFKTKKSIETFQDNLKSFLEKLDNEKIKVLREKTNELIKLLGRKNGTTQGQLSYLISEYKEKEVNSILEIAFENVKSYDEYPADINIFLNDCKKAIKGKSKFEEIQTIALQVAEVYSNKLELLNMKYLKNKQELEEYCKEIEYILDETFIKGDAKQIVAGSINLQQKKEQYKKMRDKQQEEIERNLAKQNKEVKLQENYLKTNNLQIIDVIWFSQNYKCLGIIIAKNTITNTITAYIGLANGDNEQSDIELILKCGQKIGKEVFHSIIKMMES